MHHSIASALLPEVLLYSLSPQGWFPPGRSTFDHILFLLSPFPTGLTNPNRALERFLQLPISLRHSTLSGILPFFTNLFRKAYLFALLVGLNFFFQISALAWHFKITKASPFQFVEMFRKDPFLACFFLSFHQ